MQRNKPSSTLYSTNFNLKGIIDPNIKSKTIKVLKVNVGENLCDLRKDFSAMTPKQNSEPID